MCVFAHTLYQVIWDFNFHLYAWDSACKFWFSCSGVEPGCIRDFETLRMILMCIRGKELALRGLGMYCNYQQFIRMILEMLMIYSMEIHSSCQFGQRPETPQCAPSLKPTLLMLDSSQTNPGLLSKKSYKYQLSWFLPSPHLQLPSSEV